MGIRDIARMLYVQKNAARDVSWSLEKSEKAGKQTLNFCSELYKSEDR